MKNHSLRNNLRESYNNHAHERESSTMEEWKVGERFNFLLAMQKASKKNLLEIGAGTGCDSKFFQDQGLSVICIDLSPVMIELCRKKGLTAYVMDIGAIDFPENSFDAIYSMNSMLHLTKEEFPKVLNQISTLLRDDGMFYLGMYGGDDREGVWENDSYVPQRFFSFFTDEHLEEEVTKVFDILSFNRVFFEAGNPLHFQSIILQKKPSNRNTGEE